MDKNSSVQFDSKWVTTSGLKTALFHANDSEDDNVHKMMKTLKGSAGS